MKYFASLFILCFFQALPAQAQTEHEIDIKLNACLESVATTAASLNCLQVAELSWDSELNAVYQKLIHRLNPEAQKALRNSQRHWLAFRDAEFRFLDVMYAQPNLQGTMFYAIKRQDKVDMTKQRVIELNDRLAMQTLP